MSQPSKNEKRSTAGKAPPVVQEAPPDPQLDELTYTEPVLISSFSGDLDKAMSFYYEQVNKLMFRNTLLNNRLRAALEEKKQIADLIASFEEIDREETEEKKKRVRRTAKEIERRYVCHIKGCEKSYGTEGSMAQHMKLKHPEVDYNPASESEEENQEKGERDGNMNNSESACKQEESSKKLK